MKKQLATCILVLLIGVTFLEAQQDLFKIKKVNHNSNLFQTFNPIYGYNLTQSDQSGILISSATVNSRYDCFKQCAQVASCLMILIYENVCNLFNQVTYTVYLSSLNDQPCLFEKYQPGVVSFSSNLVANWPFNGDVNEMVSGNGIIAGSGYSFTTDRLNQPMSALNLVNGYLQVTSGVYFTGDFTISMWVYIPDVLPQYTRLFDFSDGVNNQMIDMCSTCAGGGVSQMPCFVISHGGSIARYTATESLYTLNKWEHWSYTLQGTNATFFLNGISQGSQTLLAPEAVVRNECYIGKSPNPNDPLTMTAKVDDFRIYNRSFSQAEIIQLMNSYY